MNDLERFLIQITLNNGVVHWTKREYICFSIWVEVNFVSTLV